MQPFTRLDGRAAPLAIPNLDTDQIIPKQFLKTVEREGLGKGLFYDLRFDEAGRPKSDFVLNDPRYGGAGVLIAGDNFGCGSSREHAPWALVDYGFRAVVSTSIADIFRNNALKNGLLPIVVEPALHKRLLTEPGIEVTISLEDQTLRLGDGTTARFTVEPFARYCLLNGVDELAFLQAADADIARFEARPPY